MKLTLTYKEQVERTREIELPYYAKRKWGLTDFDYFGFADSENGIMITSFTGGISTDSIVNKRISEMPHGCIEITAEEFTQAMDAAIAKLYAKFQTPVIRQK